MPFPLEYTTIILIEIYVICICVAIAYFQKMLILENKPIIHWLWLTVFSVLLLPVWFYTKNPLVLIAAVLIREVLFSPFLNWIRGLKFFYVNTEDPKGSELDKIEKGISKPLYFLSCLGLLILNLIFFKDAIFPSSY